MTSRSNKIIYMTDSTCAVCRKQIFHFEGRVRLVDLDDQERAAFARMNENQFISDLLKSSEAILCVTCYGKIQVGDGITQERVGAKDEASDGRQKKTKRQLNTVARVQPRPTSSENEACDNTEQNRLDSRQETPDSTCKLSSDDVPDLDVVKTTEADSDKNVGTVYFTFPAAIGGSLAAVTLAVAVAVSFTGMMVEPLAVGIFLVLFLLLRFKKHETPDCQTQKERALATVASAKNEVSGKLEKSSKQQAADVNIQPMVVSSENSGCAASGQDLPEDGQEAPDSTCKLNSEKNISVSQQKVSLIGASALTPGASLTGTSTHALMQDGYWVTCGIEVENWTCFPLILPQVALSVGVLTVAPSCIFPGTREVMVARKTSGTATGSCGTVSWLMEEFNHRLVIMWSAPFNFNHFSNWLGVGLSASGITEHAPDWFQQMYSKESSETLRFERREYYSDVQPVIHRNTDFEVEGIMASDHKALVRVILRPVSTEHLASNLKDKLLVR